MHRSAMLNKLINLKRYYFDGISFYKLIEVMKIIDTTNRLDDYVSEGIDKIGYMYFKEVNKVTYVQSICIADVIASV